MALDNNELPYRVLEPVVKSSDVMFLLRYKNHFIYIKNLGNFMN